MAITLEGLAGALRLGDGETAPAEPVRGILNRLLGVAEALVEVGAPDAPALVKDEATVRLAAYLYDAPTASSGDRYAAAWRNSGAESLVSRFVSRRAVVGADEDVRADENVGGVTVARVRELIREENRGHLVWR